MKNPYKKSNLPKLLILNNWKKVKESNKFENLKKRDRDYYYLFFFQCKL